MGGFGFIMLCSGRSRLSHTNHYFPICSFNLGYHYRLYEMKFSRFPSISLTALCQSPLPAPSLPKSATRSGKEGIPPMVVWRDWVNFQSTNRHLPSLTVGSFLVAMRNVDKASQNRRTCSALNALSLCFLPRLLFHPVPWLWLFLASKHIASNLNSWLNI